MKKLICLCLILTLAGCAKKPEPQENVTIANPFMTFDTLEEAEKSAGLSMNLPEMVGDHVISIYRSMPERMLEIIYTLDEDMIKVRKEAGNKDISGNYSAEVYEERDLQIEDLTVHLQYKEDKIYNAIWTQDGYSYAMTADGGVSEQALTELVYTICFTIN